MSKSILDFNILVNRFGQDLFSPTSALTVGDGRIGGERKNPLDELLD